MPLPQPMGAINTLAKTRHSKFLRVLPLAGMKRSKAHARNAYPPAGNAGRR
jgi:hypothetical protein